MARSGDLRLHAIYTVLGEADLLKASIASIYQWVDGITVITTYDRDWKGGVVAPDETVPLILGRTFDPDRKIDLLISHETSEARNRNRAMDFAQQDKRQIRPQHEGDLPQLPIDYFWFVDADELYDERDIPGIIEFIRRTRSRVYQIASSPYFKRWNYRVEGDHFATTFVRSDVRLHHLRNPKASLPRRALARFAKSFDSASRIRGFKRIPAEVGRFHHGSYVGPRERMQQKLASFGHTDEVKHDWLTSVYDGWTPDSRDFHPTSPPAFPRALSIPSKQLPASIRDWHWPDGYLERDQ